MAPLPVVDLTFCDNRATWPTLSVVVPVGIGSVNAPLIADYARDQQRRGLRPRTVRRRTDILQNLDRYCLSPIFDLTVEDIHQWLEAVPRVERTRYAYLSGVSSYFCWGIAEGHATVNTVAKIQRPKLRPGLPRPIGVADLEHAVELAPPMIRAWLLLTALAGLRCQEIAGIHREHIWDHEEPNLLFVADGKGGRERVVPLHPKVLAALKAHGLPRFGPLFRNGAGRQYSAERVSQLGNQYLRSVDVDATMHQGRHRFGTDIYRSSRDIRLTQELLGHASPVTTAVYTQTSPLDAVKVVAALTIG